MITEKFLEKQVTIEWVSVGRIDTDMTYQRRLSQHKVKEISSQFNSVSAGVIIVSLRDDGRMVVIDGQHRLAAMEKLGIERVECQIIRGLTIEQEAEIYISCNTVRKSPESLDVFRARLVRRDAIATAISNVVEKCGLYINYNYGTSNGKRLPNSIWAVLALETIYKQGREQLLEEVLTLASRSWPGEGSAFEAKVLLGITDFHRKYKGKYSREEFLAKMNVTDLNTLRRRAQYHAENNGGTTHKAFAKALQETYDKGRRTYRLESKSS